MPYDLAAVERGYGECVCAYNGHEIVLRYRADINARALIAMQRTIVGVDTIDGTAKFPDFEAVITELVRVLLPSGPEIPEHQRGWDLTRDGEPLPVSYDAIVGLPMQLPMAMLMAIFGDVNDPNRRRLSSAGWSPAASSESQPTTGASSAMPNGHRSLPGPSPDWTIPETGTAGGTGSALSTTPRSRPRTSGR
jgi:hypothetical protein